MELYKCMKCGKIILILRSGSESTICCGEEMKKIEFHESDEFNNEKHLPLVRISNNKVHVKVGEIPHPMQLFHYINYIMLETDRSIYIRKLFEFDKPEHTFTTSKDELADSVYSYCNIHGFWKQKIL